MATTSVGEYLSSDLPDLGSHPLRDLEDQIALRTVIKGDRNFGAHFHGYGKGVVKGGNLSFYTSERSVELEFKINDFIIPHLLVTIDRLGDKAFVQRKVSSPKAYTSDLEVMQIQIRELGDVFLGLVDAVEGSDGSRDCPNHYRKVLVRTKCPDLKRFHEILDTIGLVKVLTPNDDDDFERLKVGQLYRTFYPREAFGLERSSAFYLLPLPKLIDRIIQRTPEMKQIFAHYLPKVGYYQILPGRGRCTIPLSKKFKGFKLCHGLMGSGDSFENVENVLRYGILSKEMRHRVGITSHGIGNGVDETCGSTDSVFLELVGKNATSLGTYETDIHLVLKKKVLNSVTYQHYDDESGRRIDDVYRERPSIFEAVSFYEEKELSSDEESDHIPEIMVKERISPSMIKFIVVEDETKKRSLVKYLISKMHKPDAEEHLRRLVVTRVEFFAGRKKRFKSKL